MQPTIALTNSERFPLLEDLSFLSTLQQDEFAPRFNFKSGDRLSAEHLRKVVRYAHNIRNTKKFWEKDSLPGWVHKFTTECRLNVPFYKSRPVEFIHQPTIARADILTTPHNFVSDEAPVEDLLVYSTSGTTGPPMDVLFDPVAQACWLPQLQSVLDTYGIELSTAPDEVVITLICAQESTLTYASLSTYLGGAGILKINLAGTEWSHPSHPKAFLEKYNPAILTGDPFAFSALLELAPTLQPKAMVSSAMKLSEALKKKLEETFHCPVLDIYSLTECRMIAVAQGERHRAIRPDLYLEIFDRDEDRLLPYGERGELVVTGGNNPFLQLLRYRTGDFCSLQIEDGVPYLIDLEGRQPVIFYNSKGRLVNSVDISRAMARLPLAGFSLHQRKNKSLRVEGWSVESDLAAQIKKELRKIFGDDLSIEVDILHPHEQKAKPVMYSSDF